MTLPEIVLVTVYLYVCGAIPAEGTKLVTDVTAKETIAGVGAVGGGANLASLIAFWTSHIVAATRQAPPEYAAGASTAANTPTLARNIALLQ